MNRSSSIHHDAPPISSTSGYDSSSVTQFSSRVSHFPDSLRSSRISYRPTTSAIHRIFKNSDEQDDQSFGLPQNNLRRSLEIAQKEGLHRHIHRYSTYGHVRSTKSETQFPEDALYYSAAYPSISQTNLIQSIGRPFNPNHAKKLPRPGQEFTLNRRISQLELSQIKMFQEGVHSEKIDKWSLIIKAFALLIGVIGVANLVFIIYLATLTTPTEYLEHFLDTYFICKAFYMIGTIQPLIVALYGRYALISLRHIRGYFLRVPLSLILPLGIAFSSLFQLCTILNGGLSAFLTEAISGYYKHTPHFSSEDAADVWDGIQSYYHCCGHDNYTDWLRVSKVLPNSCCTGGSAVRNCTSESQDVHKTGCMKAYRKINIMMTYVLFILAVVMTLLEILSVIMMKRFYNSYIRDEISDERSNISIIGGKACSLCDIDETDEDEEGSVNGNIIKRARRTTKSSKASSSPSAKLNFTPSSNEDRKYSIRSLRSSRVGTEETLASRRQSEITPDETQEDLDYG